MEIKERVLQESLARTKELTEQLKQAEVRVTCAHVRVVLCVRAWPPR